jgi:sulfatase maturation enzyme AslB (radical SAM superfamily)
MRAKANKRRIRRCERCRGKMPASEKRQRSMRNCQLICGYCSYREQESDFPYWEIRDRLSAKPPAVIYVNYEQGAAWFNVFGGVFTDGMMGGCA